MDKVRVFFFFRLKSQRSHKNYRTGGGSLLKTFRQVARHQPNTVKHQKQPNAVEQPAAVIPQKNHISPSVSFTTNHTRRVLSFVLCKLIVWNDLLFMWFKMEKYERYESYYWYEKTLGPLVKFVFNNSFRCFTLGLNIMKVHFHCNPQIWRLN